MEDISEIRKLLKKARDYTIKQQTLLHLIFEILEYYEIDIDAELKAENSEDLQESISCYIDYGEVGVDKIMKAIEQQLLSK